MSELRRNFPFYNPRYIGHMLSDITMPAMLGYFAGMLYNANNVTPEAAPVSVEMEIEACNEVLKMLGYTPPPTPPKKDATMPEWEQYQKDLKDEFAWAHITSGGTSANIEAIWVARIIKYFPLAIQDASKENGINFELKYPNGDTVDIGEIPQKSLIQIKPNESIYLYAKFIDAIARKKGLNVQEASVLSESLLSRSKYNPKSNLGTVLSEFPPVIFATGAAHYSIKKAADILGIGRDSVVVIKTDAMFRMDIQDLERKILSSIRDGKYPLAVVGVAATTEEGSVDPIHEILDLRRRLEKENNLSFWLHVDAAWGGYIASIFNLSEQEEGMIIGRKIARKFGIDIQTDFEASLAKTWFDVAKIVLSKVDYDLRDAEFYRTSDEFRHSLQALVSQESNSGYVEEVQRFVQLILQHGHSIYLENNSNDPSESKVARMSDFFRKIELESMYKKNIATEKDAIQVIELLTERFGIPFKRLETNSLMSLFTKLIAHLTNMVYLKEDPEYRNSVSIFNSRLEEAIDGIKIGNVQDFIQSVKRIFFNFGDILTFKDLGLLRNIVKKEEFAISIADRSDDNSHFVGETIDFQLFNYHKTKKILWGGIPIVSSYFAMKYADSITIDPHKLGYVQYPCGIIAFKNDRIRHFVTQRAPYITSSGHNALIHNPPRHIKSLDFSKLESKGVPYDEYQVAIDAFAPFILEGSKPGAAASSLWLATKVIPLDRKNHGMIIRSTMLATRELYEWLANWDKISSQAFQEDTSFEFLTFDDRPDTNVIVFSLKNRRDTFRTVAGVNDFTREVYNSFTIQAELGSREYSYSQAFFISKTTMDHEYYSYDAFSKFFDRSNLRNARQGYQESGLVVLRITVMNPYLAPMRRLTSQNLIREFLLEIHKVANEVAKRFDPDSRSYPKYRFH